MQRNVAASRQQIRAAEETERERTASIKRDKERTRESLQKRVNDAMASIS